MNDLPLLHFLQDRDAFASPTPLLLASVLYISALHHRSSELASLESGYFAATCSAMAELITPSLKPISTFGKSRTQEEQDSPQTRKYKAFHNILGLIMASLSSEAYIDATGSWIAMAYRLWLDHCPARVDSSTPDWCGLLSGLQVRYTPFPSQYYTNILRSLILSMLQCTCHILCFLANHRHRDSNA